METAQEALKKIPIALVNLHIPVESFAPVSNYIHNLVLLCLCDPEVRRRLQEEPAELIEELSKI